MPLPQRVGFQTKVLVPVMSIMVLLVVFPIWMVSSRVSEQIEAGAAENLQKSDAVFSSYLSIRYKGLLEKFGAIPVEPRSKAVFQLADPKTTEVLLHDLLEESGADLAFLVDEQLKIVAMAQKTGKVDVSALMSSSLESLSIAVNGRPVARTIGNGGGLFDLVFLPVNRVSSGAGALAFANRLDNATTKEFGQITHSEISLLVAGKIVASSLVTPDPDGALQVPARRLMANDARASSGPKSRPATILLNGEHFMYVARPLGEAGPGIGYILLSSYEESLQTLGSIERSFLWVQLAGIGIGGALIWLIVRRATRPLIQLRDSAEAVGRGDFSRRLEIQSRDEIGELAAVFNRMTENLEASRKELEATVETLKSTQTQLVQGEKMRAIGTLAGGIAHDFNNILGAILGFSELVLEDVPPDSRIARNTKQVFKAGQRARDLVRQILAFSRQGDPQRRQIHLTTILDEIAYLLRATIPTTVEIRRLIHTSSDSVVADSTQLHQVLMNLGTNASHAMKEHGGVLTFSLDDHVVQSSGGSTLAPGKYIRLGVSDTGHGMTKEVIQQIFEPFFTTKPVGEGTGLGLSVVHGIVKNHGGEIAVKSEPGKGTTFYVYLPRSEAGEVSSEAEGQAVRGDGLRVLVVDDEEALLSVVQQKLTRLGYQVTTHRDGLDALAVFKESPSSFDVVLTDQSMPRMTGLELAAEVHKIRPEIPFILCSGSVNGLARSGPLPAGIAAMAPKPVDYAQLTRSLRLVTGRN